MRNSIRVTRAHILSLLAVPTLLSSCGPLPEDAAGPQSSEIEQRSSAQFETGGLESDNAAAVASNGSIALWVWPAMLNGVRELRAQFMDANGTTMLTPAYRVSPNNGRHKGDVSVTAGPDGKFLLTYEQANSTGRLLQGVILRMPAPNTPIFASSTFTIDTVQSAFRPHGRAAFVSNQSKYFVAYNGRSVTTMENVIQGRFVEPNGTTPTESFVVTSDGDVKALFSDVKRVLEPEVAFAPTTGVVLVTMESFGLGSERIFAATIPSGGNRAQAPMLVAQMDGAGTFFNKTSNRFGIPMIDDFTIGGITVATLSPSCATNDPSSCAKQQSVTNVVRPRFSNGTFRNIAAAPLGSGMMVMTSQTSNTGALFIDHFFFNSSLQLIKSQPLFSGTVFTTASVAELVAGGRSLVSHTIRDPGGNFTEYFVATPPSDYVFQNLF